MAPEEHLAKADRILRSMQKLSFPEDYEPIIEGAIIAAYHLANAMLHRHRVTQTHTHFNVPSGSQISADTLPVQAVPAWKAFCDLESLRFTYVRQPSVFDEQVLNNLQRSLATLKAANLTERTSK